MGKDDRFEPYFHPELGAQMRPCQTLGGYVPSSACDAALAEKGEELKRLRGALEQVATGRVTGGSCGETLAICRQIALAALNQEGEDRG